MKTKNVNLRTIILSGLVILSLSIFGCNWTDSIINAFAASQPIASSSVTPTAAPTISPKASGDLKTMQEGFNGVYTQVLPSVVNIQVSMTVSPDSSQVFPDLPFDFPFGGNPEQGDPYHSSALGSGFIWDKEGHIITNNHVVEDSDEIMITFYDGTTVSGEVIGTDPESDLAVVKVDYPAESLQPIQIADSTQVQIGDLVAAIGNPFGLQGTMTVGIVSALGRSLPVSANALQGSSYTIPDVIQTDAPINPGNSGGVLVNMLGQLIGVPTAIQSSSGVNAGIGFVVPSVIVQKVIPELIDQGYYEHPWIGISGTTLDSETAEKMGLTRDQRGVLVMDVVPDSPADKAGLQGSDRLAEDEDQEIRLGGDVIVQIDAQQTHDFEDLTAYLARYTSAGQTVSLRIIRDGEPETLELMLDVRPTQDQEQTVQEAPENHARLGIRGMTITPKIAEAMDLPAQQKGVLVQQLVQDSPAEKAGLRGSYKTANINGEQVLIGGDVIIALNGIDMDTMQDLQSMITEIDPGTEVALSIIREGDEMQIDIRLE